MGLNFRGSSARWSYGGFMCFRIRLAKELGCDFKKMCGLHSPTREPDEAENQKFLALNDPITPLIMHSDCDGTISAKTCGPVGQRLLELIKDWPDGDYDKEQAILLAEGMADCFERRQALVFI